MTILNYALSFVAFIHFFIVKWVIWVMENVFQYHVGSCYLSVIWSGKWSEGHYNLIYSRQVGVSSRRLQIQQGKKQQELLTYCWARRDTVLMPGFHLEIKMRKRETWPRRSVSKWNVFNGTSMALQELGSFFCLCTVRDVLNTLCSKML